MLTRKCVSFTFISRDILLLLQIAFSIINAALGCAILERTSGFYLHLPLDVIGAVIPPFGIFSAISILCLLKLSARASISCSFSVRDQCHRQTILSPMLTFPSCSSRASDMIFPEKNAEEGGCKKGNLGKIKLLI